MRWQSGEPVAFTQWQMFTLENQLSFVTYSRGQTSISRAQTLVREAPLGRSWFSHSQRCAKLLLSNLATPVWVPVNCSEPSVPHIVCEKISIFPYEKEYKTQDLFVCLPSAVMHENQCYLFVWLEDKSSVLHLHKICSLKNITTNRMKTFQFIFDALPTPFPALLSHGTHLSFTNTRYFDEYCYENSSSQVKGFHICGGSLIKLDESVIRNTFKCTDGSHVSLMHVCDEMDHCHGNQNYCTKGKVNSIQINFCDNSNFRFSTDNSECQVYLDKDMENTAHSNQLISFPNMDKLESLSTHPFLRCFYHHTQQYFNISDTCKYKLNENDQLSPCISGEHVQSCENYECNMMFKCPKYYCIPWGYTCDGKWDCPFGSDETASCKAERNCSQMFRCAISRTCIHLGNICDQFFDCKMREDESFCILASATCPQQCECLGFAAKCTNGTGFGNRKLPYSLVTLRSMIVHSLDHILSSLQNVRFFTHLCSNLSVICGKYKHHNDLQLIDNSQNLIVLLTSQCICCLDKLSVIKLNSNFISTVKENAFQSLPRLTWISMSNNNLTALQNDFVSQVDKPIKLSMLNVTITSATHDVYQDLQLRELETDLYELCCLVTGETSTTLCEAVQPWYKTCQNILHKNVLLNIFYGCVALLVSGMNLIVFLWHQVSKSKEVGMLVMSIINIPDIICGVYFCCVWILNSISSPFPFINQQDNRKDMFYFVSSLLLVYYSLSSPVLLMLQAISRRNIVVYPYDSKFKYVGFVKKCLLSVAMTTAFFAILLAILFQVLYTNAADKTCIIFADPGSKSLLLTLLNLAFLSFHTTVQSVTIVMHVMMATELMKSDKRLNQRKKMTKTLATKLVVPSVFVVVSWFPLDLLFLILTFLSHYPLEIIFWATLLLTPLTAITNPLLYFVTICRKE